MVVVTSEHDIVLNSTGAYLPQTGEVRTSQGRWTQQGSRGASAAAEAERDCLVQTGGASAAVLFGVQAQAVGSPVDSFDLPC